MSSETDSTPVTSTKKRLRKDKGPRKHTTFLDKINAVLYWLNTDKDMKDVCTHFQVKEVTLMKYISIFAPTLINLGVGNKLSDKRYAELPRKYQKRYNDNARWWGPLPIKWGYKEMFEVADSYLEDENMTNAHSLAEKYPQLSRDVINCLIQIRRLVNAFQMQEISCVGGTYFAFTDDKHTSLTIGRERAANTTAHLSTGTHPGFQALVRSKGKLGAAAKVVSVIAPSSDLSIKTYSDKSDAVTKAAKRSRNLRVAPYSGQPSVTMKDLMKMRDNAQKRKSEPVVDEFVASLCDGDEELQQLSEDLLEECFPEEANQQTETTPDVQDIIDEICDFDAIVVQNDSSNSLEKKIERLEAEKEAIRKDWVQSVEKNKELEAKLDAAKRWYNGNVAIAKQENKELRRQNSGLMGDKCDLQIKIKELKAELENTQAQLAAASDLTVDPNPSLVDENDVLKTKLDDLRTHFQAMLRSTVEAHGVLFDE